MSCRRILVVDDSELVRRMYAVIFDLHSVYLGTHVRLEVEYEADGQSGLRKLLQCRDIDLVILDLEMPNLNGFQILAARQRHPRLSTIPFVVVSGAEGKTVAADALAAGADAFVAKPFTPDDFYAAVGGVLGRGLTARAS